MRGQITVLLRSTYTKSFQLRTVYYDDKDHLFIQLDGLNMDSQVYLPYGSIMYIMRKILEQAFRAVFK